MIRLGSGTDLLCLAGEEVSWCNDHGFLLRVKPCKNVQKEIALDCPLYMNHYISLCYEARIGPSKPAMFCNVFQATTRLRIMGISRLILCQYCRRKPHSMIYL